MPEQWEQLVSRGMDTIAGFASASRVRHRLRSNGVDPRDAASVKRVVELELLPRIGRAHARTVAPSRSLFSARQIVEFAELTVRADDARVFACVHRHVERGCALDAIYLDLLQPAARHLGERWVQDTLDFAAVTLGLCQMHRIVRELSPMFRAEHERRSLACHALLCPAGEEQHSLGLVMVGEFLRREGWLVSNGPFSSEQGLEAAVRGERFLLIGFSLSCDSGIEKLANQIRRVRQASLNRRLWVLVGGRVFNDRPELVARVGADATACDARQTAMISRQFVTAQANSRP